MNEPRHLDEVVETALRAARDGRRRLADNVSAVEAAGGQALAEELARRIGALYAVEVAPPEQVAVELRATGTGLAALIGRLEEGGLGAVGDDVAATVARVMAILYPARIQLERALAGPRDEGAVPLVTRRLPSRSEPAAERREQKRVALQVDIGLHSASTFFAGVAGDISRGGIFVSTVKLLPIGTELSLAFVLPSGHAVSTVGQVAWHLEPEDVSQMPGMGVRFTRLSTVDRVAIEGFLARRPPLVHEVRDSVPEGDLAT